jgi:hypothetical protein
METIMYYEYPKANYLMHMHPITNLSSPGLVRSEHVISILSASYSCFGGLNGTAGGQQGDITNAGAQGLGCWEAGLASLEAEGILMRNMAKIQTQIEGDQLIPKMEGLWPSYLEACTSLATHEQETQDALTNLVTPNDRYRDIILDKDGPAFTSLSPLVSMKVTQAAYCSPETLYFSLKGF